MHAIRSLLLVAPFLALSAQAQTPTPLVAQPPLEVDPSAPISSGIQVAEAQEADISMLTLYEPKGKDDAWLGEAWSELYYSNIIAPGDLTDQAQGYLLSTKSLSLPLYDILVVGGSKPADLSEKDDWLMTRVDMLSKLGFLHSGYDLLAAVPRAQKTMEMLKQQTLLAASLDRWGSACAAAKQLKEPQYHLLHIFCDAKTKGYDNAMLQLSLMEEQGAGAPAWFTQLIEANQYGTPIRDLPAERDMLTWSMLLSVGVKALPKDTISEAWLDTASMPQLLQLWHTNNDEMLMHKLHKRTNHFAWGHFAEDEPRSYADERTALLDHAYKRKKADDKLRGFASAGDGSPMLKELASVVSKLSSATAGKVLPNPSRILQQEYQNDSDWLAVMRAYVLMDALGYKMKPEYWVTLGEFAEEKTIEQPARYMLPNTPFLIDAMGDPAHRTDLLLFAVGSMGTKEALREQPDGLQASLLRAMVAAGLNEVAYDLAAESIESMAAGD